MVMKHRSPPSGPTALLRTTVEVAGGTAGTATVTNRTATVTGVTTSDVITGNPSSAPAAGLSYGNPWVSAANTITIPIVNPTAAAVAAGTVSMAISVHKYA